MQVIAGITPRYRVMTELRPEVESTGHRNRIGGSTPKMPPVFALRYHLVRANVSPGGHTARRVQIKAPLRAGGMGERVLATDPRLARDVAIKILPTRFSTDPGRRSRFEREALA